MNLVGTRTLAALAAALALAGCMDDPCQEEVFIMDSYHQSFRRKPGASIEFRPEERTAVCRCPSSSRLVLPAQQKSLANDLGLAKDGQASRWR